VTIIGDYADTLLDEAMALDPCTATVDGGAEAVGGLTDYGPDGHARRADAARRRRAELSGMTPVDDADALLRDHLIERMDTRLALHEAGEDLRELHPALTGPLQMTAETVRSAVADPDQLLLRVSALPGALAAYRDGLAAAAARGHVAAGRQVDECARRCAGWADSVDEVVAASAAGSPSRSGALRDAADRARAAYGELAEFLTGLRERAAVDEAFGPERYRLWVRLFLGAEPDLSELYAWGWDEFHRIEDAMRAEAVALTGSPDVNAAVDMLDAPDAPGTFTDREAYRAFLQLSSDEAMARLAGVHFRIPEPLRRLEHGLVTDAGIFYTPPSADLSRPGRVSWSVGKPPYGSWYVASTLFHEGVPGHHLQLGQAAVRGDVRSQRLPVLGGLSAYAEGWALYAEGLMDELGFFEAPGARLGFLLSQALRAARIVLDIGLHLKLRVPAGSGLDTPGGESADGRVWTPELGAHMLATKAYITGTYEITRYLGRPGQALAYKAGERVYRDVREEARSRPGFDLATFHERVLEVSPAGLGHLRTALRKATL